MNTAKGFPLLFSLLGAAALGSGLIPPASAQQAKAPETIGGGTVADHAVGPAPSYGIGGPGMVLVKNWHFGTAGTIKNYDDMSANFLYHDQFGTIGNGTNYGALTVAHDAATAINNQPVEGVDSPPVRKFTADSLITLLTPLDGSTRVDPSKHNAGNGSFMAKWRLPRAGSLLGRDIVWETRVRYVTPPYFWFALWTAGNKWKWDNGAAGAEQDLVESFGSDNGDDPKYKNFDGRTWHSSSVSQPGHDTVGYADWGRGMARQGIDSYDASQYHTWTWQYNKDNSYAMYVDGIKVQGGSDYHWTFGSKATDEPIDMDFLFDAGWGHTQIASVNKPLPASAFDGKFYEWNYSRVYLSADGAPRGAPFKGPQVLPGTVKAADYDRGGQTVSYYYAPAAGRCPNAYRPKDLVALEPCADVGGGFALTGFKPGQYVKYTVRAAKAGTYGVAFRVASTAPGGSFHLEDAKGVDLSGPISAPSAPGPAAWSTVSSTVTVPAGPQTLTLVQDAPGVKLNWFRFGATVPAGLLPDGTYKLLGKDGLALDVSGQNTGNGSGLDLYRYVGQANQAWSLHHLGGDVYEIIGVQSERGLTVGNGSAMISDYLGLPGQKWMITGAAGTFKIKDVASGKLFGYDPAGNLDLAADAGLPGQQWKIEPVL